MHNLLSLIVALCLCLSLPPTSAAQTYRAEVEELENLFAQLIHGVHEADFSLGSLLTVADLPVVPQIMFHPLIHSHQSLPNANLSPTPNARGLLFDFSQ